MTNFVLDRSNIPGVVLAAGRSSRMGRDKAAVLLRGKPLLAHAVDRLQPQVSILAVNCDFQAALPVISDVIGGKAGPMAGIHAAMVYAAGIEAATHVATVPVDSPFFPIDLVDRLAAAIDGPMQIAVAATEGRSHPVFGLWPVALADDLAAWMKTDEKRRVRDFLSRHQACEVRFPLKPTRAALLDPFFNVNTPDDLTEAERWMTMME